MKKIKQRIMYGKKICKYIIMGVLNCIVVGSIIGCSPTTRAEYVAKTNRTELGKAEELFEEIVSALEAEDVEAIKGLFSPYALENSENLNEKIEALIEFYPGRNGGYKVWHWTHETTNRGVKEYVVSAVFQITNDDVVYEMNITFYLENDVDRNKEGLYSIQVMTDESCPEGFKWREEDDDPGVYVLE